MYTHQVFETLNGITEALLHIEQRLNIDPYLNQQIG